MQNTAFLNGRPHLVALQPTACQSQINSRYPKHMAYWIFKLAEQEQYPDIAENEYVYDNTHSVKVQAGDVFLYLDKREGYSFTATGTVRRITKKASVAGELRRSSKVRWVYTAHLADVIWFNKPFSISSVTKRGKEHRAKLGILDANLLGWSRSIPFLNEEMYQAIMELIQTESLIPLPPSNGSDFLIPDNWGKTKVRRAVARFSSTVLERHGNRCLVCGTELMDVLEAAHLSPYATDKSNRANPSNGICLCAYCHRALDRRLIGICSDGKLLIANDVVDPIALVHFLSISTERRRQWLNGVDPKFLEMTVRWFAETSSATRSRPLIA